MDPQPRRDHELGGRAGLRKLDFFRFRLLLNSSATDIVFVTLSCTAVETAIAQCTSRWAMARGHRLNTSTVLAAVHGLSGLFRAVCTVEPSLFRPLHPLSPSLSIFASVNVKQNGLLTSCSVTAQGHFSTIRKNVNVSACQCMSTCI